MTIKNFIKYEAKHERGDMPQVLRAYWRQADAWLMDNKGHHGRFYQETRDGTGPTMYDIPEGTRHVIEGGVHIKDQGREVLGCDWFQRQLYRLTEFFSDSELDVVSFIGYDSGPGWERWKVDMYTVEQMYLITQFEDLSDAIVYRLSV